MTMNSKMLCFVAGRSGGHLIPALTLAKELHTSKAVSTLIITTATQLDKNIMSSAPYVTHHAALSLSSLSKNPFKFLLVCLQGFMAFISSYRLLKKYRPERIISMGGAISIPVCLMGKLLKIPIDVYELNAVPGKATLFLARFAQNILVCFEEAKKYLPAVKCITVAYPIRFVPSAKRFSAAAAREKIGINTAKKVIFISGGSQGSLFVNHLIRQWIELNPHIHALIHIIHQTGANDLFNWKEFYTTHEIPATVFSYNEDLAPVYQSADIIICRAGAGSLFEALFFEKPCIVIPHEATTTNHQKDNAKAMAQAYPQLFTMITEGDIKKDNMVFFSTINKRIHLVQTPASGKQLEIG